MKNFSNNYIYTFSIIMVVVVASLLSFAAMTLQPLQYKNIEIEKKKNILSAINISVPKEEIEAKYEEHITASYVVNTKGTVKNGVDAFSVNLKKELSKDLKQQNLAVFEGKTAYGDKTYIFPVRGKGLWGPIWGYIALKEDLSTIYGTTFDHESETPGLGAEITKEYFQQQFVGKKLFQEEDFIAVKVTKGALTPGSLHEVQAISGSTITSTGVEEMLYDCLKSYKSFFKQKTN